MSRGGDGEEERLSNKSTGGKGDIGYCGEKEEKTMIIVAVGLLMMMMTTTTTTMTAMTKNTMTVMKN
jgi:hypothetical protein